MILSLAALAQAAATPVDDEIVVMGHRLQTISVAVGQDTHGKFGCGLSQSSGNPSIDAMLCRTAARCAKQGAVEPASMRACIDARKPAILEDFAARVRGRKG